MVDEGKELAIKMEQSQDVFAEGLYREFTGWIEGAFADKAIKVTGENKYGQKEEGQIRDWIELQAVLARGVAALPESGEHEVGLLDSLVKVIQKAQRAQRAGGLKLSDEVEGLIAGSLALVALHRALVAIDAEGFSRLNLELFEPDVQLDMHKKVDAKIDRRSLGVWLWQIKTVKQPKFVIEKLKVPMQIWLTSSEVVEREDVEAMFVEKDRIETEEGRRAHVLVVGVPRYNAPGTFKNVLGVFRSKDAILKLREDLERVGFLKARS